LVRCESYDEYKFGLENLYGYASSISKQDIQGRMMNRLIVFLMGQEDTERSWSLDKSCEVEVLGENRYKRGMLYRHHLQAFMNDEQNPKHLWVVVPGVGHDSNEMFTHSEVIEKLKNLIH